ncbi:MAG TPA: hypothetical protein VKA60_04640 [Blastocatellia bacterium]|nr:hypothetical protein [Blastocatellia bacterium]
MKWTGGEDGTLEKELALLYDRVRLHVLRRYKWIPVDILEDIIQQTFLDVLTSRRRINPEIPLFIGLCRIVGSKLSHFWESATRQISIEELYDDETVSLIELVLHEFSQANPGLIQPAVQTDRLVFYNELCSFILQLVEDDELLTAIVKEWIELPDLKPQDIARKLGLEMSKMHQAQKRLRNKIKFVKEVWVNA